jgi:acylphosphatase
MQKRLECVIHGSVQGVNYRDFVNDTALDLNLTGFVRNLSDGTVEVIAEGEETTLLELLHSLKEGHPRAKVEAVEPHWKEGTKEFTRFRILYRNFLDRF